MIRFNQVQMDWVYLVKLNYSTIYESFMRIDYWVSYESNVKGNCNCTWHCIDYATLFRISNQWTKIVRPWLEWYYGRALVHIWRLIIWSNKSLIISSIWIKQIESLDLNDLKIYLVDLWFILNFMRIFVKHFYEATLVGS